MTKEDLLAVELFKTELRSAENILNKDLGYLKNKLKYHGEALNRALESSINYVSSYLQEVVDQFYHSYYRVNKFEKMTLENLTFAKDHNLEIIRNAQKLIKFIDDDKI